MSVVLRFGHGFYAVLLVYIEDLNQAVTFMDEFLTLNFAFILIAVLLVCCVYSLFYAVTINLRLNKSIKLINDLYNLSQKQSSQLVELTSQQTQNNQDQDASQIESNQVSADAIVHLQMHVADIEKHLMQVANQTELLQQADPATKMYTRANNLAGAGASIEDIIEACDLPRAEVEVLMGLQRKKQ